MTLGAPCPTLYKKCVGSFRSHKVVWTLDGYKMGPMVYSPYLRRLESVTIWGGNYKGSTFSSVILGPWVLVHLESNTRPPALQPNAEPWVHSGFPLYQGSVGKSVAYSVSLSWVWWKRITTFNSPLTLWIFISQKRSENSELPCYDWTDLITSWPSQHWWLINVFLCVSFQFVTK